MREGGGEWQRGPPTHRGADVQTHREHGKDRDADSQNDGSREGCGAGERAKEAGRQARDGQGDSQQAIQGAGSRPEGGPVCGGVKFRREGRGGLTTKVIEKFLARPPQAPGRGPGSELNLNKPLSQPSAWV